MATGKLVRSVYPGYDELLMLTLSRTVRICIVVSLSRHNPSSMNM